MSGKGFGRIDRRRRRHGQHGLRRLHEADRQRTAAYNVARGRVSPLVVERSARGRAVRERKQARLRRAAVRARASGLPPTMVIYDEHTRP